MSRSGQDEDVDRPTFAVEDDVLPGRADVRVDVQAVSFIQLACQTAAREQSHRLHTEETLRVTTSSTAGNPPPPIKSQRSPVLSTSVSAFPSAQTAQTRADHDSYTTQETPIGFPVKPNANFHLPTLLLRLLCGEQT